MGQPYTIIEYTFILYVIDRNACVKEVSDRSAQPVPTPLFIYFFFLFVAHMELEKDNEKEKEKKQAAANFLTRIRKYFTTGTKKIGGFIWILSITYTSLWVPFRKALESEMDMVASELQNQGAMNMQEMAQQQEQQPQPKKKKSKENDEE